MSDCILFHGISKPESEIFVPLTWATDSVVDIVTAVEKADSNEIILTDYWAIGDERNVNLAAMAATNGTVTVGETHAAQTVTLVIMNEGYNVTGCDNSHVHFVVGLKHSLNEKGYMNSTNTNAGGWKNCARRGWCNSIFYAAFPDSIKPIFKLFNTKTANGGGSNYSAIDTTEDRFALFAGREVFDTESSSGTSYGGGYSKYEEHQVLNQITWYATAANRIKQVLGTNSTWWERSSYYYNTNYFCLANKYGNADGADGAKSAYGLAPFGCI